MDKEMEEEVETRRKVVEFDSCWIIKNPAGKALNIKGDLLVFSGKDAINRFVANCCPYNFKLFISKLSWSKLVGKFANQFKIAILDYAGGDEKYGHIPLLEIPESEGRA